MEDKTSVANSNVRVKHDLKRKKYEEINGCIMWSAHIFHTFILCSCTLDWMFSLWSNVPPCLLISVFTFHVNRNMVNQFVIHIMFVCLKGSKENKLVPFILFFLSTCTVHDWFYKCFYFWLLILFSNSVKRSCCMAWLVSWSPLQIRYCNFPPFFLSFLKYI